MAFSTVGERWYTSLWEAPAVATVCNPYISITPCALLVPNMGTYTTWSPSANYTTTRMRVVSE
jgi:hypothetical protein